MCCTQASGLDQFFKVVFAAVAWDEKQVHGSIPAKIGRLHVNETRLVAQEDVAHVRYELGFRNGSLATETEEGCTCTAGQRLDRHLHFRAYSPPGKSTSSMGNLHVHDCRIPGKIAIQIRATEDWLQWPIPSRQDIDIASSRSKKDRILRSCMQVAMYNTSNELHVFCAFFVLDEPSPGVCRRPPFPSHRFPPRQTFVLRLSSMCYHQFPPLVWFRRCKRVSPSSFLCTRTFVPFVLFGRASTHLWTAAAAPTRAAEDHDEQVVQGFAHSSHALAREANIASAFAIAFSHRDTCRFEEKRTSSSPSHLVRFVNFRLTGRTWEKAGGSSSAGKG